MRFAAYPLLCLLTVGLAMSLAGCEQAAHSQQSPTRSSPMAGKQCTVQFRRDALGVATNHPVSPQTRNSSGADTQISGTLLVTTDDWVAIKLKDGVEVWVPNSSVLCLEMQ